jgi:hypothetical protein
MFGYTPDTMQARLVHLVLGRPPVEMPIDRPVVVIGRQEGVAFRIDDEGVSRQHARLELLGDEFVLTDLGSTNGTRVNGTRLNGAVKLRDGDIIGLGSTSLLFRTAGRRGTAGPDRNPLLPAGPETLERSFPTPGAPIAGRKKIGSRPPPLAIAGGVLVALCLFLACAGAAGYVLFTRFWPDATPEDSGLTIPAADSTPASVATVIAKDQVYLSAKGRYSVQLPAGSSISETQNRLYVTYQDSRVAFSVDHYADQTEPAVIMDKVVASLKRRAGAKLSPVRDAVINGAKGKRVAAEYSDEDGRVLSITAFAVTHSNNMSYLIQVADDAADLETDEAVLQGLVSSLAFR